jgi:hypothetical protein
MPWINTTARQDYASGRLRLAGGGDADVFTKPGRQTRVELRTSNLRVDQAGRVILLDIFYSVREMRSNNTFLTWSGTAELPFPQAALANTIVIQDTSYNHSWIVIGQHHEWLELANTGGTVIERGQYRIDGSGDDLDNAGIQLSLVVHLSYFDPR